MQKKTPVTVAEAVGKLALVVMGFGACGILYILLIDKPFGWQITIAVVYTAAVFFFVFFRWRGMPEYFSLGDRRIQQQLPRLLTLHVSFLAFLLVSLTEWHGLRSRLPDYWVRERGSKHESLYSDVMVGFSVLAFYTQILISRRILKRVATSDKEWRP